MVTSRNCVFVALGALMDLLYGATIYGWPSLEFILKQDNYFEMYPRSSTCNESFIGEHFSTKNKTDMSNCNDDSANSHRMSQDAHLNLVFTVCELCVGLSYVVNGYLFDKFGTYVVRIICR